MMQREDIYVAKGEKGHAVFFGENPYVVICAYILQQRPRDGVMVAKSVP